MTGSAVLARYWVAALGVAVSVTLVGCAEIAPGDREDAPQTVTMAEDPAVPAHGTPTVALTVRSEASLPFMVDDPAELLDLPQRQLVVEGTVRSMQYTAIDQLDVATDMTVEVDRSDRKTPSTVVVRESGGYVPVDQLPPEDRQRMGLDGASDDAVIEFAPFGGADHPRVGDRYLFILTRPPGTTSGAYVAMGSVFGRFSLSSDGSRYIRAGQDGGLDRELDREVVDRLLS